MEHRYAEDTAMTAKRDGRDVKWIAFDIASFQHHVGDLDRSLCVCRAPKASAGRWMQDTCACLLIGGGRVVRRNGAKAVALVEVKHSEFGLADASGVLQYRHKHLLKIARGA